MNLLVILLQISSLFCQIPDSLHHKPLTRCSDDEVVYLMNYASQQLKYQELDNSLVKISKRLNGSVLLAQGKKILYYKNTGYKKLYYRIPHLSWSYEKRLAAKRKPQNKIKANTPIELASLSKQFTAAAILKLVSENKIDTNDLLVKYFPNLLYSDVKISHLLSHTSGLPDYIYFKESSFPKNDTLTNQKLVQYFIEKGPNTLSKPGSYFDYVNTNYAFLAAIIEQVANCSFQDYLHNNIFQPADLKNTFLFPEILNLPDTAYACGHLASMEEVPFNFMNYTLGDKGVYSTTQDLYKWATAFFIDYKVLPKKWVDLASTPHNLINGKIPAEPYGYGFRIEFNPSYGKLIYHGGLWRGFHNLFLYRPADQLILIFLSNYRNRAHSGKSNFIMAILDGA